MLDSLVIFVSCQAEWKESKLTTSLMALNCLHNKRNLVHNKVHNAGSPLRAAMDAIAPLDFERDRTSLKLLTDL